MANIIKIIREELQKIFSIEDGVADRYAEKAFNIPDERKQQDVRAMSGLQMEKEKPFAFIGRADTPVFKNPKSLENIQVDARAIADENGDVYVAQSVFSMDTHGMMGEKLGLVDDGEMICQPEFLLLHFNGNNSFIFSDTSLHSVISDPGYEENYDYIISMVKQKNPEYKINIK